MSEKPTLAELGGDYAEDTEKWFEAWRSSPRTDGWDACQWQYMKDTAVVHTLIYGQGMFEMLPDFEKRLDKLGLRFDAQASPAKPKEMSQLEIIQLRRAERRAKAAS